MILAAVNLVADGAGRAEGRIGPAAAWETWDVGRVTCQATVAAGVVRLYRETESVATFVDGTVTPAADLGEYAPAVRLESGQTVLVVWTGATPGGSCALTFDGIKGGVS